MTANSTFQINIAQQRDSRCRRRTQTLKLKRVVWQLCTTGANFNNTKMDDAASSAEARRRTGLVGTAARYANRVRMRKISAAGSFSRGFMPLVGVWTLCRVQESG
jgi:hypothetical protein